MTTSGIPVLRPATPDDLPLAIGLLRAAGLPDDGVAELGDRLVVAEVEGRVVGCAGLEIYGTGGLLRSVAVSEDLQGRGVGAALTGHLTAVAIAHGLERLYLLTETAASFFGRQGFTTIDRADVEAAVLAAPEFARLCPASAEVMVRHLAGSG